MLFSLITSSELALIKALIYILPTFLFFSIIVLEMFFGAEKGCRTSLHLFIQSVLIFLILAIIYLSLVETDFGDRLSLSIVNLFLGGKGGLQEILDVSTSVESLKEVLVLGLPSKLNTTDELAYAISILTGGAKDYLETLANYVYHLLFAVVFLLLYVLIDLIFHIIFAIFRGERSYKKKINKRFLNNKELASYHKNKLGGALIGLVNGIIIGLIGLSFYGGTMYIATGDTGKGTLKECTLSNENANEIYQLYKTACEYGKYGIVRTLNNFTDEEDGPIYLLFFDTVNSGIYNGNNKEEVTKVKFRKEIANYTVLAKKLIGLMIEYSVEDVNDYFNGKINANDFLTIILEEIMYNPDFQIELLNMVDEIDENEFLLEFVFAILDSYMGEIHKLNINLSDDILEPLKIAFGKGYYSSVIESESELKNLGATEVLPYIKVSDCLNKEDCLLIAKIGIEYFNMGTDIISSSDTSNMIPIIRMLINYIEKLSIFTTEDNKNANATLGRLYKYVESKYLDDDTLFFEKETSETETTKSENTANELKKLSSEENTDYTEKLVDYIESISAVDWTGEVEYLFCAISKVTTLYQNMNECDSSDSFTRFLSLFDKTNINYSKNKKLLDEISSLVYDSGILGEVLSSKAFYGLFEYTISTIVSDYEMPNDITYNNVYDEKGNLIEIGELYYVINGIRLILENSSEDLIAYFRGDESIETSLLLNSISDIFGAVDECDLTISDYILKSEILETAISKYLINLSKKENAVIYITKESLIKDDDGNYTDVINADMLKEILDLIPDLLSSTSDKESAYSIVKPIIDSSSSVESKEILEIISKLLDNEAVNKLINNKIMQGVLGNILYKNIKDNNTIVVPNRFADSEEWVSKNNNNNKSEVIQLFNSLKLLGSSNISELFSDDSNIIDKVYSILVDLIQNKKIDDFFESEILLYTISSTISSYDFGEDLTLIIPNSAKEMLTDEKIEYVINKEDIIELITSLTVLLEIKDNEDTLCLKEKVGDLSSLFKSAVKNRESLLNSSIISASLAYSLNEAISSLSTLSSEISIVIPDDLKNDATIESLTFYSISNAWYNELRSFLKAIDEIYGVSENDNDFDLASGDVGEYISNLFKNKAYDNKSYVNNEKTKIELLFDSRIIAYTISKAVDVYLTSDVIDATIKEKCKNNGIYDMEEIRSTLSFLSSYGIVSLKNASFLYTSSIRPIEDFDNENKNFYLVRGLISKIVSKFYYDKINNPSGIIVEHPLAYESTSFKILKKSEISSILDILGNSNDIGTWSPNDDNLDSYINYVYDSGSTKSYLIVATVSKKIMETSGVVVPIDALDNLSSEYNIISPLELYKILNVMNDLLSSNEGVSDFNIDKIKVKIELFDSIIMNATICHELKFISQGDEESLKTYALEENITVTKDVNDNKVYYLNEEEYTAFVKVINEVFSGDSGISIDVSVSWLQNLSLNKLETLLDCSITRIMVSDLIVKNKILVFYNNAISYQSYLGITMSGEVISDEDIKGATVYDLSNCKRITGYSILSYEQIKDVYNDMEIFMRYADALDF